VLLSNLFPKRLTDASSGPNLLNLTGVCIQGGSEGKVNTLEGDSIGHCE
jgi:hypothetical protein